ncbi:hypothetical protein R1flu_017060 [Riccia fluitans]|uniref:Alpha/beta hydrolase fold-3 domain-containing protein n=1 Tax=Riccia fluitans TaxID=41844 RepID=A0ABD1YNL9_9MARC
MSILWPQGDRRNMITDSQNQQKFKLFYSWRRRWPRRDLREGWRHSGSEARYQCGHLTVYRCVGRLDPIALFDLEDCRKFRAQSRQVLNSCFFKCAMLGDMGFRLDVWCITTLSKLLIFQVLRKNGTINKRLFNSVTRTTKARKKPSNGVSSVDVTIDQSTGVWCRVYVPSYADPSKKLPIIMYFHGGGFVLLSPDIKEYDMHCRRMAKLSEVIVVTVCYRKAPEWKYPTAYEDGFSALQWVRSQAIDPHPDFPSNADFSRVFLAGDNAGGNIVHHLAARAGVNDIFPLVLGGMILIQPFFGAEARTVSEIRFKHGKLCDLKESDWYWKAFLPAGADRDHPCCNVCGPKSPSLSALNLPKILVVVGGRDPLQDRQIEYGEALQRVGKACTILRYEKAFHGFFAFRAIKYTSMLHYAIEEFVHPPMDDRSYQGSSTPRMSTASHAEGFSRQSTKREQQSSQH